MKKIFPGEDPPTPHPHPSTTPKEGVGTPLIIPKGKVKKKQARLVCGHQQVRFVRSTGAFVASDVPCKQAANVCVLSGNDGRLSEAPIRHSAPVLL